MTDVDAGLDVVIVLPSLSPGGAERVMVNHAIGLHEAGDRVRVVLTDGSSDGTGALHASLPSSIEVIRLQQPRVRAALPALIRLIRREVPDVVVATHTHLNLALCAFRSVLPRETGLVLREPTHAPVMLDGRPTWARRAAQRLLYRRADTVIATSRVMEADLRQLTGASVVVLPNPVRIAAIRSAAAENPVAGPVGGRRFITVGRLDRLKSLPDLLAAFAAGSQAEDELVLVGDGPARAEIVDAARRLGIVERVDLRGFLAEPWNEVAAADAFVLASRAEGMPNAVLEALAVGTPVIATEDLDVLSGLQQEAGADAVILVPRDRFAEAVARAVPRSRGPISGLAPCLLPEIYDADVSTRALRSVLRGRRGPISRDGT